MTRDENDRYREGDLNPDPKVGAKVMRDADAAKVMRGRDSDAPPRLVSLLDKAFGRMAARARGEEKPIPLPWPTLAEAVGGGLWPGGVHVLVGNTGSGKTQFCLQVAMEAAKAGIPALYVFLEAEETEIVARAAGIVTGKHWSALYLGRDLSEIGIAKKQTEAALRDLPLYAKIGIARGETSLAIDLEVDSIRREHPDGPLLVVLDFLQIVGGADDDLRKRIGDTVNKCAQVAREQNAAVLVASATSRENYFTLQGKRKDSSKDKNAELGKGDPSRFVGLGKESGDVEYAAKTVMALTQEPWGADGKPPAGGTVIHVAVAKVRHGKPSWVELRFDGRCYGEPTTPEVMPLR